MTSLVGLVDEAKARGIVSAPVVVTADDAWSGRSSPGQVD